MSAARILPPEEWDRLGDSARADLATLKPDDVAMVVVEDEGAIVAHLAVLRIPHLDTFWMAPEAAGNAGITRALLRAAISKAREWAPHWIYANSDDDATGETLKRLGGQWVPFHTFMLGLDRIEKETECHT